MLLRDPVDRAYSNWMHLWSDGLEPESDFLRAVDAEESRRAAGWAPFWRYRALGRYGEQLHNLYSVFDRSHVLVMRDGHAAGPRRPGRRRPRSTSVSSRAWRS